MDPVTIYTYILGGFLTLLYLRTTFLWVIRRYHSASFAINRCSWTMPLRLPENKWVDAVSWEKLVVQLIYCAGTFVCNSIGVDGLADAGSRAASLSILHFVPLLAASRPHLLADFFGITLTTLVQMHRIFAWMVILQAGIHIATIGRMTRIEWSTSQDGIILACLFATIFVGSVRPFRRHTYELFIKLHGVLAISILVFGWRHVLHHKATASVGFSLSCLIVTSALLASTTLAQVGRTIYYNCGPCRRTIATIQRWGSQPGKVGPNIIQIRIRLSRGWDVQAGQTVYLYVNTMRPWSFIEAHPFAIAWWSQWPRRALNNSMDKPVVEDLKCINDGLDVGDKMDIEAWPDITGNEEYGDGSTIYLLAQPRQGVTYDLGAYNSSVKLRAIVDGPYGDDRKLNGYGHVVMFAQGIGIAGQLSYIKKLFQGSLAGELPTRRITLIWETQGRDMVVIQPWMTRLLKEDHDNYSRTLMLNIRLYITDQKGQIRYGRRVTAIQGPIDIRYEMKQELVERKGKFTGRMLITVSGTKKLRDALKLEVRHIMAKSLMNEPVDMLCLDFQPADSMIDAEKSGEIG